MFEFKDPGRLIDGDLELVLVEEYPGDPDIGFVPAYRFEMRLTGADKKVGNTHHIVMHGGHIAHGVLPEQRGHRYAARACRLLFPLARGHDLKTIWITCNPDNIVSARTCELVEIVDLPEDTDMYRKGERQKCRYKIEL